jgi:hypothetical protein
MVTCKQWDKFIDDYLAGRLGPFKRLIFRLHFVLCPPCKRYLEEYRRTLAATRREAAADEAEVTPLPTAMAETITRRMCEQQGDQDPPRPS